MAPASLVLAGLLGASYVVFWVLNRIVTARRYAARARAWGCKEPPLEPSHLPFGIDHVRHALAADQRQQFPQWMVRRAEAMGAWTWQYRISGNRIIATHEPDNVKAVLASQFGTFDVGEKRRALFWPMLGNGIFTQSAREWKHSREMMRPQFTRDQVSDLELEERHVQNMMSALDAKLLANKTAGGGSWTDVVDLQDLFFRLTLDSATEFLLGESANSQLQHIPGYPRARNSAEALTNVDFAWAFDRGQAGIARRARFGPLYWLVSSAEFRECVRQCNAFMDHYVRRALNKEQRAAKQAKLEAGGGKPRYVFLNTLAEQTQDPVELRSQIMHILLAGRDTTASMMGWLFLELARDPARYKKLRDTVIEQFGTYHAPRDITFSALKNCQYLQHCNNEILRLYPVVPINSRLAMKDGTIPVGGGPDGKSPIFVPKGTSVEYCVYALHRRKDLWGPDADEFKPERWENRKVGWEYLPFNGGPRICLGQQFALTETSYVTVRLLQRFEQLVNKDPETEIRHNLTLTTCSATGVKVSLKAVDEN